MTSILTNTGAMTALQTLRSVGSNLSGVQEQVSSGLRVKSASDNVAYWSISTTMRSDNKALSAASDALGVGAAKVDTAYAGTEAIVDILTEFKATLVTAKETSTDEAQIQNALAQLNAQAEAIVVSSSFSGVNWLQTSASEHINDVNVLSDHVVEGFIRDSNGGTKITQMEADLRKTSMLNTGGGGILQKDVLDYYMPLSGMYTNSFYHEGHEDHYFKGPVTFSNTDNVNFKLTIDQSPESAGETFTINIDKSVVDTALSTTDGVIRNVGDLRLVMQKAFNDAGAGAYADVYGHTATAPNDPSSYEIRSLETSPHVGSSIFISDVLTSFPSTATEGTLGLKTTPRVDHDNMITSSRMSYVQPFKVMLDATISFDLSIDNNPVKTYTIDRASVDAALGTTDGMISSAADLKTIVDHLTAGAGMSVTVSGGQLTFQADQNVYPGYGNKAVEFNISSFRPNPPFTLRFDLAEIDITTSNFTVDEYVEGVEFMLNQAIDSAATLGSLQQRIDLQEEYSHKLMDGIESGVSRLVDTDVEEASAKLAALKTQQQLAIQGLQIANGAPGILLQLFSNP
ncbi:flagellin [Agrobacterium sp. BA1120]|uniref:flagellin N-terminal helical domain-containing protein n=1 Tax=Agrobacterium sp. BA1120 TaxID=3228927 RepID=UPI00336A809E